MNYCPGCAPEMSRLGARHPCCRRRLTAGWLHVLIIAALDDAGVIVRRR